MIVAGLPASLAVPSLLKSILILAGGPAFTFNAALVFRKTSAGMEVQSRTTTHPGGQIEGGQRVLFAGKLPSVRR
jgi:hypothetical protein